MSQDSGREWLGQVFALLRKFQQFINADIPTAQRTAEFTIDGVAYYQLTPGQWRELMEMAPEDVRRMNK